MELILQSIKSLFRKMELTISKKLYETERSIEKKITGISRVTFDYNDDTEEYEHIKYGDTERTIYVRDNYYPSEADIAYGDDGLVTIYLNEDNRLVGQVAYNLVNLLSADICKQEYWLSAFTTVPTDVGNYYTKKRTIDMGYLNGFLDKYTAGSLLYTKIPTLGRMSLNIIKDPNEMIRIWGVASLYDESTFLYTVVQETTPTSGMAKCAETIKRVS